MKKGFLGLLFFGLLSIAQAQIGIRAGFSSTNFSNGDSQRAYTSLSRLHLGGYYRLKATEKLAVEPGLAFAGKGYTAVPLGSTEEVTEKLTYVEVPVLARYSINSQFNAFVGPQASFLLARTYSKGSTTDTNLDPVGGYEIGAVMGVGYSFPTGVNLQLSYDFGLVPFNYYEFEVNNTVFKLSVGYTLPSKASKEKTE